MGNLSIDLSGLHDNPFSPTASLGSPYLSSSFREALEALYYGLEYGTRIILLSAEHGFGKTTLLRHFERRMQKRSQTIFLACGRGDASEMVNKLLRELGGDTAGDSLLATLARVDEIITGLAEPDKPFILLLDCDQDGGPLTLDTVRHLTNLASFKKRLLRLVIGGCPEIVEELQNSELAKEIRRVPLAGLKLAEVEAYINHRMRPLGSASEKLFIAKASALVAERSAASPSEINQICFDLVQNPGEQVDDSLHSATWPENTIPDEGSVERILSVPEAVAPSPVSSLYRRTAVLTCLVLLLVLAAAGLWYRSIVSARGAKHVAVEILSPSATTFRNTAASSLPVEPQTKATNTVAATTAEASTKSVVVSNTSTESGSEPTREAVSEPAPVSQIMVSRGTPQSSPMAQRTVVAYTPATPSVATAARISYATHAAEQMAAFEIRLGDAYMNLGDYDRALRSFSKAIALVPDNKEAVEKAKRAQHAKATEETILQ